MKFSRQEYWNEWTFPRPGDLPDLGVETASLLPPALASRFFTSAPPGSQVMKYSFNLHLYLIYFIPPFLMFVLRKFYYISIAI